MPKRAFERVECDKCGQSFAVLKGRAADFRCPNVNRHKESTKPAPTTPEAKGAKP